MKKEHVMYSRTMYWDSKSTISAGRRESSLISTFLLVVQTYGCERHPTGHWPVSKEMQDHSIHKDNAVITYQQWTGLLLFVSRLWWKVMLKMIMLPRPMAIGEQKNDKWQSRSVQSSAAQSYNRLNDPVVLCRRSGDRTPESGFLTW